MIDDENSDTSLRVLDLEAWAPPPLPTGFADRVVARVHSTDAAVEAHRKKSTRRWLFRAGVAAVVASVVVIAISLKGDHAPTSGSAIATKPQHLVLDGATAELDTGASVAWTGDHVTQRSGAATYRATRQFVIDVGGATIVADASNSTVRVEAKMNLQDAKVIGTTALTAAVVSLVTIVVYEGHARVTSAGQTVVVNPGNVVAVEPNKTPVVDPTPPPVPVVAGTPPAPKPKQTFHIPSSHPGEVELTGSTTVMIHDPAGHVSVSFTGTGCGDAELTIGAGATNHDVAGNPVLDPGVYPYELHCTDKEITDANVVSAGVVTVVKDAGTEIGTLHLPLDNSNYNIEGTYIGAMAEVTYKGVVINRMDRNGAGRFAAHVILEDPNVVAVQIMQADHSVHILVARGHEAEKVATPAQKTVKASEPCNSDVLTEQGTALEGRGDHLGALDSFEKAYACKADTHVVMLAFMASCNANELPHAKKWWKLLTADRQSHLKQICLKSHITQEMLDAN